jgi:hypothetical protein
MPRRDPSRKSITNRNSLFGTGNGLSRYLLHPVVWFTVATVGLVWFAVGAWNKYEHELIPDEPFRVTPENAQISTANEWIDVDPQEELSELLDQEKLTLLDPDAVERIARGLELWPFVQTVRSVQKHSQGLTIDLEYRAPVAVVNTMSSAAHLVDASGVIIPGRVQEGPSSDANELQNHEGISVETSNPWLWIFIDRPNENGLSNWERWPDPRVVDAAEVVGQVIPFAYDLGIRSVVNWPENYDDAIWPFELWTASGGKVIWCDDPARETPESIAQKRSQIEDWIARNGSLDQLEGWRKLDLRSGQPVLVPDNPDVASRAILETRFRR